MKKTLLSLFIVVAAVFGLNAATVIEATSFGFSANTDLTGVNATLKNSGFTLTFAKGNSTTNPTFNKTSGEFRLYGGSKDTDKVAGNTMTITGTKLTSVVLTAGSKPTTWSKTITASTGTVEIDSVSHNLTWKGDAASVTFTICRNATDLTKAVQYRFKTITIEGEGGGSTPDPEVKYLEIKTLEDFYSAPLDTTVKFTGTLNVVYQSGRNMIVTDASKYSMQIYSATGYETTYRTGDVIPAGTTGKVTEFAGNKQIDVIEIAAPSSTTTVTPTVVKVSELPDVEPYQYAYVKINDVTVTNDPNNSTSLRYYQLSDGESTFIAYDSYLVNQTSSSATERILKLEEGKKYNIVGVLSSYKNNKQLNLISIEVSSGVDEVEVEDNTPVEYYNLNGVKVGADNLTPGIYVSKKGNKVTKVLVK